MSGTPEAWPKIWIEALRPRQWIKNILVFAAPVFAFQADPETLLRVVATFVAFCAISSATYLINDRIDLASDRLHPLKQGRPLASGRMSLASAYGLTLFLVMVALALGLYAGTSVFVILATYVLMQALYNLSFKHVLILDVMTLTSGFVLRAVSGGFAARVELSPWFLFCVALLAFYVGLQKRKSELRRMQSSGITTRRILHQYSLPYLIQIETAIIASILMAYALWTIQGAPTPWLMLTVPYVLYGILRYQYLSGEELMERPEEAILKDRPLFVNLALWGITCVLILGLYHSKVI